MARTTEWQNLQKLIEGEAASISAALTDGLKRGPQATADAIFAATGRLNELYARANVVAAREALFNGKERKAEVASFAPPAPVS